MVYFVAAFEDINDSQPGRFMLFLMNKYKLLQLNSLAVIAALAGMSLYTARGQDITWGGATTITGDANLINTDPVDALLPNGNYNSPIGNNGSGNATPTSLTADGVTFNAATTVSSSSVSDGKISLTASGGNFLSYGNNNGGYPTSGSASAAFAAVQTAGGLYASSTALTGTITISASVLIAGDVYDVQIFNFSNDGVNESTLFTSGSSSVVLEDNNGAGVNPATYLGQYATGVFTATGSAETIDFANATGGYTPVIGAINVENVTPTPEPSTCGLMALGALAVAGLYRRQRQPA